MIGDGQVSLGSIVVKPNAIKGEWLFRDSALCTRIVHAHCVREEPRRLCVIVFGMSISKERAILGKQIDYKGDDRDSVPLIAYLLVG